MKKGGFFDITSYFLGGLLYGLIKFFIEITKKSNKNKNQLGLSIALIITCTAAFLITIN